MTGRRTSNSSKGLWTGLITLLLFSVTVRSQAFSNVTAAATTTTRATIIEEPSGNSTSRKIEPTSPSLKRVNDRPEARPEAVAKIVTNVTSKFEDADVQGDPVIKREKLKVTLAQSEVENVEGKRLATEFLPEFGDKEDYDEIHDFDDKDGVREPTTPPSKKGGEKKNGAPTKTDDTKEFGNSDEYDFKEIDGKHSDNNYSLVNDTNVNYIASKIAQAAKNEDIYGTDYKSVKGTLENPTNLITSGDDEQSETAKGPKSQVEVFKNSTLPKVLRLSEDKAERTVDAISIEAENTKNLINDRNKTNGTTFTGAESAGRKNNDERILPIPRGRTIAFGGLNEFLNESTKTGESKVAIGTAAFPGVTGITEKSVEEQKSLSFKPYPYLKVIQFDLLSNVTSSGTGLSSDRVVSEPHEEASALENAIGQKQEEGQIVVTESSVVIDNSIQQFKPSHPKRSGNSSRSSPGLSLTFATTSSNPLDNDKTVTTTSTESMNLENGTTLYAANLRISNAENDVPRGNDDSTSVVNKDTSGSLDLTGNGITEVTQSGKNDSNLAIENYAERTETVVLPTVGTAVTRATVSNLSVQNTTERTNPEDDTTITDVQINAEDSMLKISPLDVTETSTITSSTEAQSVTIPTEIPSTTVSMSTKVTGSSTSGSKLEEIATTVSSQGLEVSVPVTSEPEESSSSEIPIESTTSKVEYEFIGLTDSTVSQKFIASTVTSNVLTLNDEESTSSTSSSLLESSTFTPIPTLSTSTQTDLETTPEIFENQETSTYPTTLVTEMVSSDDETTIFSTQETSDPENTTFASEVEGATTTSDFLPTEMNESTEATTEIVYEDTTNFPRVTEIVPEVENATDSGRSVDSSTYSVETSTSSGNSSSNTETSTDSSNFTVVTDNPEFTVTSRTPLEDSTSSTSTTETITTFIELDSSSESPSTSENPINTVTVNTTGPGGRGVSPDELTALVRIVFEGTWVDICPHLPDLRQSLADLLTSGLEKVVLASQIIFEKNPCTDGSASTMATTELSLTTLLLYVVDKNGNYDAEMTKILPTLYSRSPIKLQVTIRSFQLVQDADSSNAIAVVVVSCVAFICLVLLAGLLFIMRKRQTRFNYGERCRPVSLDAYSLDSVSAYNSVRGRKGVARASKRSYGNPTFEDSTATPSHPLNFAGLSTFCNEQNIIAEEFAGIPQVTARIDELPQGAEVKNRYANVVPLPETRVSLMKINNDPLTEYINASYVRGPKNATKYYIACQAPIESTVTDFWRMIWEQQSKVVIMLTDLVENGVEKCAEYLPPSEVTDCHRLFGDFQVTLKKRETKEKYAISTLHLKNLENNTFREISHIWYLWPANGVQSDAAGLIAVLLEARALQRGGPGPVVVHCSPGTGRTGTLIALDLGIRQYEITRTVDVPRVVYTIRRDRAGAVQTKEQYAFIYKALNLYATKLAGGALES